MRRGTHFLFSIDLEDILSRMRDGDKYDSHVPQLTKQYLDYLKRRDMQATFFIVGDIARAFPDLIKQIIDAGHEIAAHSDVHTPLNELSPKEFAEDLDKNLQSLHDAGTGNVRGFRAPVFSLTGNTSWAYTALQKYGFTYSSSVLPSINPLYGWNGFGSKAKVIDGILELPMTLLNAPKASIPFGGGTYFRILPQWVIKAAFKNFAKRKESVLGYFHPYDIDLYQPKFMHPGINNSHIYNFLMYYNRESVFQKLDSIIDNGWNIIRYDDYIENCLGPFPNTHQNLKGKSTHSP